MAALLGDGFTWDDVLAWRAAYMAWHRRVTARVITTGLAS